MWVGDHLHHLVRDHHAVVRVGGVLAATVSEARQHGVVDRCSCSSTMEVRVVAAESVAGIASAVIDDHSYGHVEDVASVRIRTGQRSAVDLSLQLGLDLRVRY